MNSYEPPPDISDAIDRYLYPHKPRIIVIDDASDDPNDRLLTLARAMGITHHPAVCVHQDRPRTRAIFLLAPKNRAGKFGDLDGVIQNLNPFMHHLSDVPLDTP